jgi:hypothetical protein
MARVCLMSLRPTKLRTRGGVTATVDLAVGP